MKMKQDYYRIIVLENLKNSGIKAELPKIDIEKF